MNRSDLIKLINDEIEILSPSLLDDSTYFFDVLLNQDEFNLDLYLGKHQFWFQYSPRGHDKNISTDILEQFLMFKDIKENDLRILIEEMRAICQDVDEKGCLINLQHDYCLVNKDNKERTKRNFHDKEFSEIL